LKKVRETREKLQTERREHKQHFAQLSEVPFGQVKEQFEKKNKIQSKRYTRRVVFSGYRV
jgi:hypothetical protein